MSLDGRERGIPLFDQDGGHRLAQPPGIPTAGRKDRIIVAIGLRAWRLEPGAYRWQTVDSSDRPIASGEFEVRDLPALIRLPLPPQQEISVKILAAGEAASR
jgi:hypothetical protein